MNKYPATDCSIESLKQSFHPLGQLPIKKHLLIMDQYAYDLVYGDQQNGDGPNPEDYLPMIDQEQQPEYLLFPNHNQRPVKSNLTSAQPTQTVDKQQSQQDMQVAVYQEQGKQLAKKVDLLRFRNPHLLEPSTFNIQDKSFYFNQRNGQIIRPFAFSDIKFKRPCFYETSKQFRETFNLGIPLGSGSTSCVRRCENRERANSKCAKMINIDCNRDLLNEFNILKKLYHPLIIDIHEILEEPKKLYLIEELCMGGDLAHAMASRTCYNEEEAAHIVKGALISLAYLHKKQIIYRNIKPGNFVFKKTGAKMAKLIDFGSAVDLTSKNQREKLPLGKIIGQPSYMAPEVLKESYNEKADIWSTGVLMFELLSNCLPFDATSDQELMMNILDGSYQFHGPAWRSIKDEAKDLIKQLLMYNPNNRISAQRALRHPWIQTNAPYQPEPKVMSEVFINMIDCRFQNKIQEAILSMICHRTMNREDLENLEYAFLCMDQDYDGVISFEEFKQAFDQYYKPQFADDQALSDEDEAQTQTLRDQGKGIDLELVFMRCDLDGDGFLDWHDFLLTASNKHRTLSKYNLDEAFYSFDLYQKNFVTYDDFECAFGKFDQLGNNVWEDIISHSSENEDGLLSTEEFNQMMLKMIKY